MGASVRLDAERLQAALLAQADAAQAVKAQRFFKTGPGQYGEGDQFLGIPMPALRAASKQAGSLSLAVATHLIESPWHEVRMFALVNLVQQARRRGCDRAALYRFYLAHRRGINNWDLVDVSAPDLVGTYLLAGDRRVLDELAASTSLWDRRIAVLACLAFIRAGETDDIVRLAQQLLADPEDLIHKAVGWMLREAGKREPQVLENFLAAHTPVLPRTLLRYAIEKLPAARRQYYLAIPRAKEMDSTPV